MSEAYYLIAFSSVLLYLIFYVKKSLSSAYLYFWFYLLGMFSLDLLAYIVYQMGGENLYIYNFLTLIEFNMLFFFYKGISHEKLTKKIINASSFIFNITYLSSTGYYIYSSSFKDTYNSITTAVGSILIAIVLFLFFRELLLSNKVLNFKKELSFWITLGLLVYYLGSTPVTSLLNFLNERSIITIENFTVIQFSLGSFMHACFIFGILWSYKRVK
jgi:hypothetical protein